VERVKESYREQRGLPLLETLAQDVRLALRVLRKSPDLLCRGGVAGIGHRRQHRDLQLVHAVLLRELPYPEPDRLVRVIRKPNFDGVTLQEYEYWKEHTSSFSAAAGDRGIDDRSFVITQNGVVRAMRVTADFFRVLRVAPAFGREFTSRKLVPADRKRSFLATGCGGRLSARTHRFWVV